MSKKKSRIKKMLWLCRVKDEPLVRSQLFSAAPVWPKKKSLMTGLRFLRFNA